MYDHAQDLVTKLVRLRSRSKTVERPIIFIAYSLGGIVLKSALIHSHNATTNHLPHHRSIKASTYAILFIGTPQQGVDSTSIASFALNIGSVFIHTNSKYYKTLKRDSDWLQQQCSAYLSISMDFITKCFYETKKTYTKAGHYQLIVPKSSAVLPGAVNQEPIGLNKDHLSLVKFAHDKDEDFMSISEVLSSLVEEAPVKIADVWSREREITKIGTYQPPFSVPYSQDPKFVERKAVEEQFTSFLDVSKLHKRLALYGRGGTGKTALAIELSYRFKQLALSTAIFWVNAIDRTRFEQGFAQIAEDLQIPQRDDPDQNIMLLVANWLGRPNMGPWFLILDNADDVTMFFDSDQSSGEEALLQFLPQSVQGSILVTTKSKRAAAVLCDSDNIVEVPPMNPDEALSLFRKRLRSKIESDDTIDELLRELEYLPQSITQATAFMVYNSIDAAAYLTLLKNESEQIRLLEEPYADLRRDRQVPNSVIASGKLSFKQIERENPKAAEVLSLIGVIDYQAIPQSLLDEEFRYQPLEITKTIGTLKAFSLLVPHKDNITYDVHRLVHISIQAWLKSSQALEEWQQTAVKLIARCFPSSEFEMWPLCSVYLPHADAVLRYSTDGTCDRTVQRASILSKTAAFLDRRGYYQRSRSRLEESLSAYEKLLGTENEETLVVFQQLALTLKHLGKLEDSECMCRRALEARERLHGISSLPTASVVYDLGVVLRNQGNWEAAGSMHRRALDTREKVLGREHRLTIESIIAVSAVLWHQGKNEEAETLNLKAIDASRRTFGSKHPETLTSLNNMGNTMLNKGIHEKAEKLYKEVIEARAEILGPDHPDTLITCSNLGVLFWQLEQFDAAEEILQRVVEIRMTTLGREHMDTIASINNLAMVIRGKAMIDHDIPRLNEAASLMREVLSARSIALGPTSPDTLGAANNLALMLRDIGDLEGAEAMFQKTVASLEARIGADHPNTLSCYANLATVLQARNLFEDAESMFQKCLQGRQQILGNDHFKTKEVIMQLQALEINRRKVEN